MGLSSVVLAVLLALTAILLGPVYMTDGEASDCCTTKNIPSECHFLCGTKKVGIFSVTRWRCTHKYFASVKTCQAKGVIDYVRMFGEKMTQSVANGFDALTAVIKQKLIKAKDFAKLTVDELKKIPQDVLASLQDGLENMTSVQFGGIVTRLKYFTKQNLNSLLTNVPSSTFVNNLPDLNLQVDFDNDQLRELARAGLRAFGKNVGNWTAKTLRDMNKLLVGLETSEIVEIAGNALQLSHNILCDVNFNTDQKNALSVPVKKAFGEIADWDENAIKEICKVLEVVPPTQLLKISAKAISKTAAYLSNKKFFVPQIRVLVGKIKEAWGEVNSWDDVKLKNIGNLLNGINKKDIASFLQETVKKGLSEIGNINWNEAQAREWIKKVKEVLGNPEQWTVENIRDLGQTVVALLPSDLQKIGNATLFNALKYLKEIEVHVDQVQVIIQKVKGYRRLEDITKEDLLAMQKVLDGFLSSDIGRLSQVAVSAAFPELIIAKKVGMPILRAFIDQYKKNPIDNKIGAFKSFFKALSRVELNETAIKNIVDDIQRAGVIDWDITQALELVQRIKKEWGDFNGTDDDNSDEPRWGFQTFKKLGKIVLGLAKEDLRELPIRGIEDILEVLGGNKGWSRGQIVAALTRVREYWEAEGLSFTNLTETDVNGLGEFVAGLALKELKKLPEKILHVAVKRLGECLDLPEDKLRSRAFLAIELLKNETGVDILNSLQVADLGNLLKGVNRAVLEKISKEGFLDNLFKMTRIKGMSDDRLWQIVQLAKKHFDKSDIGEWLAEQWQDLGPALKTLDVSEIRRISKEAFEEAIDELGELDVFSKQQARALIEKAKEFWDQRDVSKWTGEQLRKLGSLVKGLNREEIKALSKDYFKEAIGALGERLDLDEGTLSALAERAKEVFVGSDVTKFVVEELKILGRVVLGLTSEDLGKLNIDSIDVITALGKWKGWTEKQLAKLGPKIQAFLVKANKPDYYMSLGHLAPIMKPSNIERLSKRAFDLSAKQFGETDGWTNEQLKALANKAITNWGPSELWEKAQVSELGNIVEGLKSSDLGKLRTTVVDAIKPDVIAKLAREQLKAFTRFHFTSMDPVQVDMISDAKVSYLTADQQDGIQTVKNSDPVEPNPWPQESCAGPGCPSAAMSILPNIILLMFAIFVYFTNF